MNLKVAVVGVGAMGRNHARVYSEMANVKLVAVADTNDKLVEDVARCHGACGYINYVQMLEEQKPNAISIAVPTINHLDIALQVIQRGIHVLIEKPIALDEDEAQQIIVAAEEAGVQLMVGHIERFNPVVTTLKSALANEEVISINITRVGPLPPRIKDVGVIIDLGTHDIDLIRFLSDSSFDEVYAVCSRVNASNEDTALMIFRMRNGVLAQITTNWLTPYKEREIVVCTRQRQFRANLITQQLTEFCGYAVEDGSYQVKNWAVPYVEPLRRELDLFVDSIIRKCAPPVTGRDGLSALSIAQQCLDSATNRARI